MLARPIIPFLIYVMSVVSSSKKRICIVRTPNKLACFYGDWGPCQLTAFHMGSHDLRKGVIHLLLLLNILLKAPPQY